MNTARGTRQGFTLVELMIALVVIAIIVALAYPAYGQYIRKAKRGEAQQLLMNWSANQEVFRANNPSYADADALAPPVHDDYTLTVSGVTAMGYTLQAAAHGAQANDSDHGVSCATLSIDQNGRKTPIECWGGSS